MAGTSPAVTTKSVNPNGKRFSGLMRTISKSSVAATAAALLREKNLLLSTLVRLLNANKRKQALEHNLLLGRMA
jgi:hypothetical protein